MQSDNRFSSRGQVRQSIGIMRRTPIDDRQKFVRKLSLAEANRTNGQTQGRSHGRRQLFSRLPVLMTVSTNSTSDPRLVSLWLHRVFLSVVITISVANTVSAQTPSQLPGSSHFLDGSQRRSDRHPFEGFTQPYRIIEVAAGDSGRVAEISVRRGDTVKAGQLLLRLDTTVLETSRQIAVAQAAAVARIKALTVEHSAQQSRLTQIRTLAESDRASTEELRQADADEQIALFNLQGAEEERQQRQLAVEEIKARIAARSIRSPIDGTVTAVIREVGEFVSPAKPEVVTVVDLRQLRASFYLPTLDALRYHKRDLIVVHLHETSQRVTGKVEYVSATTEAESGRVRMDVVIDNRDGKYRSGLRCVLNVDSVLPADKMAASTRSKVSKVSPSRGIH